MEENIDVKNVKSMSENKYIYIKNHKATFNRNINKDTNKPNKEKNL